MGVTPSEPVKANRGVRARVAAAGKALEGNDQQIYLHYITIKLHQGSIRVAAFQVFKRGK